MNKADAKPATENQRGNQKLSRCRRKISDTGHALTRPDITHLGLTATECKVLATRQKSMNYLLYALSEDGNLIEQDGNQVSERRLIEGNNNTAFISQPFSSTTSNCSPNPRLPSSKSTICEGAKNYQYNDLSKWRENNPCLTVSRSLSMPALATKPPNLKYKSRHGSGSCSVVSRLSSNTDAQTTNKDVSNDPWSTHTKTPPFAWSDTPPPLSLDDCLRHLQRSGFLTSRKTTRNKSWYDNRAWALHQEISLQRRDQQKSRFPPRPPVSLFGRLSVGK